MPEGNKSYRMLRLRPGIFSLVFQQVCSEYIIVRLPLVGGRAVFLVNVKILLGSVFP